MNNLGIFAPIILKPIVGLVWRTDLHLLRLSEDDDLWYFGSRATREKRNIGFGYGGRPSGGKNSLMEVLEPQVSYNWNDYLATTVYYSHGFGESVVDADFSGKSANFGFFEVTLQLLPMEPQKSGSGTDSRRPTRWWTRPGNLGLTPFLLSEATA